MGKVKNRISKIEKRTEVQKRFSTGIVLMLKNGKFESDGQIYDKAEDIPKAEDGNILVFVPK